MAYSGVALNRSDSFDLWKVTTRNYDWDDKSMDYLFPQREFLVVDQWFQKDRMQQDPGTEIERQVVYRENGSTTFYDPGETRTSSSMNVVAVLRLPYVSCYAEYSALDAEIRRNAGRAKLKGILSSKRGTAKMDMAVTLDEKGWDMPDTANNKLPHGIPYWIVPITGAQVTAGTASGAHQGQNPTGFSTCANIDASDSTYSRWRNYNAGWTNSSGEITEEDLLRLGKMRRSLKFKSPHIVADIHKPMYSKFRHYTCETIIDSYSAALRRLKDDIGGNDPARYYGAGMADTGEPMFFGSPVHLAEPLDTADTTNRGAYPWYSLNHDYFYPVVEQGMYFSEDGPWRTKEQPDLYTTYVELAFNFLCTNRQLAGGVISYVAAA